MVDAQSLLSAEAVRERAHRLLQVGLEDRLPHFRVDLARLDTAVDLVLATMRRNYPLGEIPFHSRWRHFIIDGEDRWAAIAASAGWSDPIARARAEFDLAIVSVLLDAGAGALWRYHDNVSDVAIGRSEGLALASLDMFDSGAFSATEDDPLRVDAEALLRLTADDVRRGFQVTEDNPLVGIEGRVELLRRLGAQLAAQPAVFGGAGGPRPGGLVDHLLSRAGGGAIAAPDILSVVLQQLGPIWPSRLDLGGVPLGDCWRHPALVTDDASSGLVPLHKLSQWLTYSLIEPLQRAGVTVADIDGLTGLAEYRNGGLFIDTGVLAFRDPAAAELDYDVSSPLIVEWRALTVALLDGLAQIVRERLGVDAAAFPLAKILEGGTWAAGRTIAFERRPDGSPPIRVVSDGTVF
ncbi:URC4/urg3 family protein [Bradyrhizobium sp. U87765 SZCCT0131]|uniref:URC4/urg3 family protein n=1 Tax=unclassified Bradyrhizobium TaxID=2631580 RepID=UPI001BADEC08|nr:MULTISPECIES: URC4/urg3 family protein [unclassified Bradyrhizobium]MBR1222544.1 URC4/urg3 family protein [Bradyrhizobium sp. U87765 SZCCT0131]MBR1265375.1 URC4/urg3 family protein [Bradyrhizobium sp. U87765 SZCCT0134]MBR1302846.1 URC4/urg3 family protein [Bradyrhizobium sp. U87765 SZCCT0110]MBR1323544.1 URC4/urg3 family protein [Bradyrhizobium sp. U87765 SZCCT0109]MBR1346775.1 URC4/urg3 family protein [Bradyrhizobium sp. U87765 SZCCT0048]